MPDLSTVLAIETAYLSAWPALETIEQKSWKARFSRGYTKRANSIHAFDPADEADAGPRIAELVEAYRARNLRPIFRVNPLTGPAVSAELDAQGWDIYEPSLVLFMPEPGKLRAVAAVSQTLHPMDSAWGEAQARMAGYSQETQDTFALVRARLPERAAGILVYNEERQPVAAALSMIADDIAVYNNVVVDAAERGKGYGRALMHAAFNWAVQNGARRHSLNVLANNERAVPLYKSLGLAEIYGYHYRRAPL